MRLVPSTIEWLLQDEPWVVYNTRLDLLHQTPENDEVRHARSEMVTHPKVKLLLEEVKELPAVVLNSHKSAGHPIHKMSFLAEIGLNRTDEGVACITEELMHSQSEKGPFQVLMNVPVHFVGTGKNSFAWALCDAPLLLYSLVRFGYGSDERISKGIKYLAGLVQENGWPCAVSPELGKFRGPGRKTDPCPYATLVMLKLLKALPEWRDSEHAHTGAESILHLWDKRRENHPYLFYMGTDFCKLKAPLIWYDILHVCDVFSNSPWLKADPRLKEMIEIITAKADPEGRFTPESVWTAWKDWEFGQKKTPSRWLTFLITRMMMRNIDPGIDVRFP